MRTILLLFTGFFLFGFFLLWSLPKWYLKTPRWTGNAAITAKLAALGDSALRSDDVPVAAVLLYNGRIISEGYNTVRRMSDAGGHAEINAISAALKSIGADSFAKMDRSYLQLVTTWEPCLMCQGAIAEYNIKHVVVMKMKSADYWWKQWRKIAGYEWRKQEGDDDTLQEGLFKKHPQYSEQHE